MEIREAINGSGLDSGINLFIKLHYRPTKLQEFIGDLFTFKRKIESLFICLIQA